MQNNTFSGLFVGQNIIALPRIDSTNNYIKNLLSKSEPLPEGTVIMAEEQYAGRGQFNNQWLSEPGKNLTFSILLFPSFLHPNQQFLLNIAISIAINEVLAKIIGSACKIKWPNDIFFNEAKLAGILIENNLSGRNWNHAIVGIGINVNQTEFPSYIQNVTSLKQITSHTFDLHLLLRDFCTTIEQRYLELKNHRAQHHYSFYLSNLYRYNEHTEFQIHQDYKEGKIVGVDERGSLLINIGGEIHAFAPKEVSFRKA